MKQNVHNDVTYRCVIDRALNYGGIVNIIGHELSHAFDDRGTYSTHAAAVTAWLA